MSDRSRAEADAWFETHTPAASTHSATCWQWHPACAYKRGRDATDPATEDRADGAFLSEKAADLGERPCIVIDPAQNFGTPAIAHTRTPVETIAGPLTAGDTIATVMAEYGLRRGDLLTACWYMGTFGPRRWRRMWGGWAEQVHPALWARDPDYDAIPDPPIPDGTLP